MAEAIDNISMVMRLIVSTSHRRPMSIGFLSLMTLITRMLHYMGRQRLIRKLTVRMRSLRRITIGLCRPIRSTRFRSSSTTMTVRLKSSCSTTIGILGCSPQQSISASHRLERPLRPSITPICYAASSSGKILFSLRISRLVAGHHRYLNSETLLAATCTLS